MTKESRFSRNLEKQTKRQIVGSALGIVLVIALSVKFGPVIIGDFGNFISSIFGKSEQIQTIEQVDFLEPPTLDSISNSTDKPNITISGLTQYKDSVVEIFINNSSYKNIEVDNEGKFQLKNVAIADGENIIKARVKRGDSTSDFSEEQVFFYSKDAPKLDISFPQNGATFEKADREITLFGKTDQNSTVTVNGFWAIVDGEGNFSYYLRLNDGENEVKIVAENKASKKTEKSIKITYKP